MIKLNIFLNAYEKEAKEISHGGHEISHKQTQAVKSTLESKKDR